MPNFAIISRISSAIMKKKFTTCSGWPVSVKYDITKNNLYKLYLNLFQTFKFFPQNWILGSNSNWTSVQMTFSHHSATHNYIEKDRDIRRSTFNVNLFYIIRAPSLIILLTNQGRSGKSKFVCSKKCCNYNIKSSTHLSICL